MHDYSFSNVSFQGLTNQFLGIDATFAGWQQYQTYCCLGKLDLVGTRERLKRIKLKTNEQTNKQLKINATAKPPWKRKLLRSSQYDCAGHLWPPCDCRGNLTQCCTVISVSTNANAKISAKNILVSPSVFHSFQNFGNKYLNKSMGAHHTVLLTFYGVPTVKRNPSLSVWDHCFT